MCYRKLFYQISIVFFFSFVLVGRLFGQISNKNNKGLNFLASGVYSLSSFENQESTANMFSVSFAGLFQVSPQFLLGGFFETSIKPFETTAIVGEEEIWHWSGNVLNYKSYNDVEGTRKISQTVLGVKALYLLSQKSTQPFIGGGGGLYFGSMEQEPVVIQGPEPFEIMGSESESFKSAMAIHFSTGFIIKKSKYGFYVAFTYHIISRSLNKGSEVTYEYGTYRSPTTANIEKIVAVNGLPPGDESSGFNNYGINIGIIIGL